jgi:hypothetical protein
MFMSLFVTALLYVVVELTRLPIRIRQLALLLLLLHQDREEPHYISVKSSGHLHCYSAGKNSDSLQVVLHHVALSTSFEDN